MRIVRYRKDESKPYWILLLLAISAIALLLVKLWRDSKKFRKYIEQLEGWR